MGRWGRTGAVLALGLSACGDDGTTSAGATTTGVTSVPNTTSATEPTTGGADETTVTTGSGGSNSMSAGSDTTSDTTTPVTSTDPSTSTTDPGGDCTEGEIVCNGQVAQVCDGMGGFKDTMECPEACENGVGCVACVPDSTQCVGDLTQKCNDAHEWVDYESCDPLQGLMCDADLGKCAGTCAKDNLGSSYIGCDYYPVTLANLHESLTWPFQYAVVVANTTDVQASVTVTRGADMITQVNVGPGTAEVIILPYVEELLKSGSDEAGPTVLVKDGSYRLRSTGPVTVYQYEPYEYHIPEEFPPAYSYTNDASLLLPVNTWTGNYIVASRNHWYETSLLSTANMPGFYAVVAREDNTTVTLTPSATGKVVAAGGGVAANGTGVIVLNESDVLEVFSARIGNTAPNPSDLTGTIISADKPVEVFGGHKCTNIPHDTDACDRLEEAMPPIETLATEYIVTPPLIPTGGNVPKAQMVRIIATEADTSLTYDPPQNGAPTKLANAGDYAEIAKTSADFQISADKKILVSQYMQGQAAGGNSGDPAMALAVATEQFRSDYLIHAPLSYETNYANVTAPMGAKITIDGAPVANFTAIGNTGFGVARISIPDNGDGNHRFAGDQKFGVSIYGYGQYTSYWYPGGLDLNLIAQ